MCEQQHENLESVVSSHARTFLFIGQAARGDGSKRQVRKIVWILHHAVNGVVVYLCLSSSSDSHLLLRSCLGTGMRFELLCIIGSFSVLVCFLIPVGVLVGAVSYFLVGILWTFTTLTSLCSLCAGKHVTVSRYCRFCARF